MATLSILLTNNTLSARAGSELYLRDVAIALLGRGHRPIAFSPVLGPVAEDLRKTTVPVIDDIARLGDAPDVIHGQHHIETLIAALAFPQVPIVHFCHGWSPWEETPLKHPSIRRYVAVDDVCFDRLVREEGIPSSRVERLLNFVDLERFRPRPRLPPRPRRGLILSNQATGDGYCRMIAAACSRMGVALDVVGLARGNASANPETLLPAYDIVFAKARAALEALAVGCAVVLSDGSGCGPLVTLANFDRVRGHNFGVRELSRPHDVEWYAAQIAAVTPEAAAAVRDRVRAEAGLDAAIDRLIAIYETAIGEPPGDGDALRASAAHLQRIAGPFKQSSAMTARAQTLSRDLAVVSKERDDLAARVRALEAAGEIHRTELDAFNALPTLRVRDAILRVPVVGSVVQTTARRLAKLFES
jgi:Glycosyltransferase Family 4